MPCVVRCRGKRRWSGKTVDRAIEGGADEASGDKAHATPHDPDGSAA